MQFVSLCGREGEQTVVDLLAAAQVHRPPAERANRGRAAAESYAVERIGELWGCERGEILIALAGVERRGPLLWLNEIAVVPEMRGNGLGRQVIAFLRGQYPGVAIEGDTIADVAGFYRALGFELREAGALPAGAPVFRFSLAAAHA